jgi:hypothetical protein
MINILIRKDESTEIPRQVADLEAARAHVTEGMPVFVLHEDGSKQPLDEALAAAQPVEAAADEPAAAETPAAEPVAADTAAEAAAADAPQA